MTSTKAAAVHEHVAKRILVVLQRGGVPYEVGQQVCAGCASILAEKPVRRAAA
jgi:hypothetical protein